MALKAHNHLVKITKIFLPIALVIGGTMAVLASYSVFDKANAAIYNPENCEKQTNVLNGKTIYWLGSSVTKGVQSLNISFSEYIAHRNQVNSVKDAVSGSTMFGSFTDRSFVARLKNGQIFDYSNPIDTFICQLSTNDAQTKNLVNLGSITGNDVIQSENFDTTTTLGAMEYIITYVKNTWNVPIYFLTNTYFADEGLKSMASVKGSDYKNLIDQTYSMLDKWNRLGYDVRLIDLFNDEQLNDISDQDYKFYMHDAVHPHKAGYLEWWVPAIEQRLLSDFA